MGTRRREVKRHGRLERMREVGYHRTLAAEPAARARPLGGQIERRQAMVDQDSVQALTFDVFGTVVDWRSSIIREGEALGRAKGLTLDWACFADAWRGLYQPNLSRVRNGELPWTKLDDLHRMSLDRLLADFGIAGLTEAEIDHLNRAWHRLDPWPDAVPGLTRLRRRFILATCSNGNVALMVNMARRAGLPWDAILGAEPARHYKPQPEAYLITADMLGLRPDQCMMVAAHNGDLAAAAGCGLRTAFVPRPAEHGPGGAADVTPKREWDVIATDFVDLATKLGC
jgi:2-haloacid dehalogenase